MSNVIQSETMIKNYMKRAWMRGMAQSFEDAGFIALPQSSIEEAILKDEELSSSIHKMIDASYAFIMKMRRSADGQAEE